MTVLFWDIDLTLLTTGRAGVLAWDDASREVAGRPLDLDMKTAGLTDHQIAAAILREAGEPAEPAQIARMVQVYERQLPKRLPEREGRILDNVRGILERLRATRPDVLNVLLTGNTRDGAGAKLAHYRLDGFFDGGAFSEDAGARSAIGARALILAQECAAQCGQSVSRLFVIGDTPHDIAVGRAIGARTIAVATGVYSSAELVAHEPWMVFETLPEPAEFERLIDR